MKTALVIGATGMVGKSLVEQLLDDNRFSEVLIFVRRAASWNHPKLREHKIDFSKPEKWQHLVKGDVLFSTLGTTLKKAGSKQKQYQVDHQYQYQFAASAARNGVPCYVLVSAMGADEKSRIFYSHMKGELERDVQDLAFQSINILKPGILDGDRQEERKTEKFAISLIRTINNLGLLRKYRPIMDQQMARAMINIAIVEQPGVNFFKGEELFRLGK
jgi:uncharacterized protein YbjT (DUF2867 family)